MADTGSIRVAGDRGPRRVRVLLSLGEHPDEGLALPAKVYAPPSMRAISPRVHSAPASAEWTHRFMISPMWPIDSGPASGM